MQLVAALHCYLLTFFSQIKHWFTVISAENHKMLLRTANREDPDQNAFSEAVVNNLLFALVYC